MENRNALLSEHWKFSKISQWLFLVVSLTTLQVIAGGPLMLHMLAVAALIATLASMVLSFIIRFMEEILSLLTMGGVILGVLFLFGLLFGGFMVMILVFIVVLGAGHWVGLLVPEIVLFSGQYWILILAFAFEIAMTVWNLDFITRAARLLQAI